MLRCSSTESRVPWASASLPVSSPGGARANKFAHATQPHHIHQHDDQGNRLVTRAPRALTFSSAVMALALSTPAGCGLSGLSLSEVLPVSVLSGGPAVDMELGRIYVTRDETALKMDLLYSVVAEEPRPAVVLVHGDFWFCGGGLHEAGLSLGSGRPASPAGYPGVLGGQPVDPGVQARPPFGRVAPSRRSGYDRRTLPLR